MGGTGTRSSVGVVAHPVPVRQSPRKPSQPPLSHHPLAPINQDIPQSHLPTPLSNSPSTSSSHPNPNSRYPPQFDQSHPMHHPHPAAAPSLSHSISVSARASTALYTPRSPYRPGEYGRRPETASERTKIERRLFGDDHSAGNVDALERIRREEEEQEEEEEGWKRNRGSSPLQPAFEARLILRKGAPVDLISWLRRNFHHIPSPSHPSLTSSTSLLAIRALLAERFPRLPESEELVKAVTAAFPRVHLDYGQSGSGEPPMIRGLVWNGKETVYEDSRGLNLNGKRGVPAITPDKKGRTSSRIVSQPTVPPPSNQAGPSTHLARQSLPVVTQQPHLDPSRTRSPTQSTLVSPTTSSSRRILPNTPARSVLEEFAVLATLADKTPATRTQSLPGDRVVHGVAAELARVCDSFGGEASASASGSAPIFGVEDIEGSSRPKKRQGVNGNGKRRASTPPPMLGSTTPNKLEGLLAAAEKIEGSPMTSFLDPTSNDDGGRASQHKRRRTIGGMGSMREIVQGGNETLGGGGRILYGMGSPRGGGKQRVFGRLGNVDEVEEGDKRGMMGSASDAEMELVSVPPPASSVGGSTSGVGSKGKKKATAAAGPGVGKGQGRGKGVSKIGGVKGRAHADSNASQISLSAVSSMVSGDIPVSVSGSTMEVDDNTMGQPIVPTPSIPQPSTSTASSAIIPTHPHTYSRPRKSNELATEGLYPGIDCKPPHPYHEMIRHAIESAPDGRLQLSQIYCSIAERFPFFGALDERKTAGWQNSIRHNLSLKKMFVRVNKVDGIPDEGGKGGWWTVEPGIPDEGRPGRKSKAATYIAPNSILAQSMPVIDPLAGPGPAWKSAQSSQATNGDGMAGEGKNGINGMNGDNKEGGKGGRKSEGSCSDVSGVVGVSTASGSVMGGEKMGGGGIIVGQVKKEVDMEVDGRRQVVAGVDINEGGQ